MKKKIIYIHGAFSAYKPNSEKVVALKQEFEVCGVNYSMEKTFEENLNSITNLCLSENADAIIGTSLGGLYAAEASSLLGVPAILINPCVEPVKSLSTIIGEQKNFTTGEVEVFTQELVNSFPNIATINSNMLVCVGLKDDLIDANITIVMAQDNNASVIQNSDADHYWEMFEHNKEISSFIENSPG